ncbi:MAG: hypothetical protein GXP62_17945 [Oligoflexia bacterium]|nr:hypothetical protein [Oligoflexia bacterium]
MSTADYLEHRERWRKTAVGAAADLRLGRLAKARTLLQGWRFDGHRADALLKRLATASLAPSRGAWAVGMGASSACGAAEPAVASAVLDWRNAVYSRPQTQIPGDPLAWALSELAAHAWLVDAVERRPWAARNYQVVPLLDAEIAGLWKAWAQGHPWDVRDAWETLFLPPALRAFSAVVHGRRLPREVRHRALGDAHEGFFYVLVGDGAERAGWREVAVRVIEAAGMDPVDALASALPLSSWPRVARCAVTRGHGRHTAAMAWGETVAWEVQARELRLRGQQRPQELGDLLDLHLAMRLVTRWSDPAFTSPARGVAVVRHNRGRARGRLRAVLREAPAEHLLARLVELPGLAERTSVAVAVYARDWAWQQVQHGFSFYDVRTIEPPCVLPEGGAPPLSVDDQLALQTWVLLVLLKGRLAHLRQWVRGGDAVDKRDTTWGRLLADDCPEQLRSYPGATRAQGLSRLRAELSEHLPLCLRRLRPVLDALASIDLDQPGIKAAFLAAVSPSWHDAICLPRVRYRRFINAALVARESLIAVAELRPAQEE